MNKKTMLMIAVILVVLAAAAAALAAGLQKEETPVIAVIDNPQATEAPVLEDETAEDAQALSDGAAAEAEMLGLGGVIVQVTGDTIVFDDLQFGMIQATVTDDTLFEGVDLGMLQVGQYIFVDCDGKMTRSIPAQVTALRVYAHLITGEVTQAEAGSITLVQDETGMEIVLHLPEGQEVPETGSRVTATTNGAMTMSLPPQASAVQLVPAAQIVSP